MLPTVVGVPGAWHTKDFFHDLSNHFRSRRYSFVSQNAPGVLMENAFEATSDKDADSLRAGLLIPLIESGKDVVLLMHSYGGVYGGGAVQGLSKAERRMAGKTGGVVGLIFVSAVTPMIGKSTLDMMGTDIGHLPPWVDYDSTSGFVTFSGAKETMYHDLPESVAARYISMLKPQSLNSLNSPISYSPLDDPFYTSISGYIFCGADRVIPLPGQEAYAALGNIKRTVLVPEASHAFFASGQERVVDAAINLLADFDANDQ